MELRCSRDLALRLGAIEPESVLQHRLLNYAGKHILIRATDTSQPLFWAWQSHVITAGSSQ